MEEEENAGHAEALIISSGIAPKEKESSEDLKAKENGEKDLKVEMEAKEEKEKGALTAETHGSMRESAHTRKEKEKEDRLMNLLKETTKRKKKKETAIWCSY